MQLVALRLLKMLLYGDWIRCRWCIRWIKVFFKSEDPEKFAKSNCSSNNTLQDYELIGRLASELGTAMKGLDINQLSLEERMQERGW